MSVAINCQSTTDCTEAPIILLMYTSSQKGFDGWEHPELTKAQERFVE